MDILEKLVNDIMSKEEEILSMDTNEQTESPAMDGLIQKLQTPQLASRNPPAKYHKIQCTPLDKNRPWSTQQLNDGATVKRRRCCVDGCDKISSGTRRFFKFPDRNENSFVPSVTNGGAVVSRRRLWEIRLLGGAEATDEDRVCSHHFETKRVKTVGSRFVLEDSAVPTIRLPKSNREGPVCEQEEDSTISLADQGGVGNGWTKKKTMCLIEQWALHRKSAKMLDKNPLIWTAIAEEMHRSGFPDSRGASCYLRFRYLVKRYEELKERAKKRKDDITWPYFDEIDRHFKDSNAPCGAKIRGLVLRPESELKTTPIVHMRLKTSDENAKKLILKEDCEGSSPVVPRSKPVMLVQCVNGSPPSPRTKLQQSVKSSMARLLGATNSPNERSITLQPLNTQTVESDSSDIEETQSSHTALSVTSTLSDSGASDSAEDLEIDFAPRKRSNDDPPKWFVEYTKHQQLENKARCERDSQIISLLQNIEKNTKKQVEIFSKLRVRSLPKKTP